MTLSNEVHIESPAATISVIMVTYNAPTWISRSVDSLLRDASTSRATVELILIDNASGQETQDVLDRYEDRAKVIRLPVNVGFGKACNVGAAASSGQYILLLNPDTEFRPGVLDALVGHYREHPHAGIVGGRTLHEDGSVDPRSCWGRPTLWSIFVGAVGLSALFSGSRWLNPESLGSWDRSTSREVDIVTGCLLFASVEVWHQLQGFDETYFMYGEDADLCLRAKALGYSPRITPEATIVHAVGASSTATLNKQRLLYRGRCSVIHRHLPRWQSFLADYLVQLGVWVRMNGARFGDQDKALVYRSLWLERREWRQGWSAASHSEGLR